MRFIALLAIFAIIANARIIKRQSNSPIPGLFTGFGRGYDIVTERTRAPIVQFSYDDQQAWTSPYDGKTYVYPDQCYLTNIARGTTDDVVNLFNTWETYFHTKTSYMGVSVGLGIGATGAQVGLAFNQTKGEIDGYFKNMTRNIAIDNRIMALYQLDLWPLTDGVVPPLAHLIKSLPRSLSSDSDKQKYQTLINGWGTHYIASAQFGAKLNITTAFDQDLINKYGSKWVSNQIGLSLEWEKIKVGIDGGNTSNKSKTNETFAQHSENFVDHIGGQPDVFEASGYQEWLKTVPSNPGMILDKSIVIPIHDLIDDPVIKELLRQALVMYVSKGPIA